MDFSLQRRRLLTFLLFLLTGAAWANNTVTIEKAGSQADPVNVGPILFVVTFNEAVTGFDDTDVNLGASTTSGTLVATVTQIAPNDGTTYQVSVAGMTGTGNVIASIPANAAKLVSDGTTNTAASTSSDNTVRYDISPPTVTTLTPDDDETGVAVNSNLQILFSSNINLGTGTIELRQYSNDAIIESYALPGSPRLSITGGNTLVINPSSNLTSNTHYYLIVPAGAVNDNATNDFAGLTTKGDWDFTTVNPPPDVQTEVPANDPNPIVPVNLTQVVITFTEPVVNVGDNSDGDNRIIIKNRDTNATHETIDPTAAGRVTLSGGGATATITLTVPLGSNTRYAVLIGNSVFEDLDGAAFAGTPNDTDWRFRTIAAPAITDLFSPFTAGSAGTNSCVGEKVKIEGTGFSTTAANNEVRVNGLLATVIGATTDTDIVFQLPAGLTSGSYTITVKNNDAGNGLTGTSASINFKPALVTNLNVFANPASAAVGGASSIKIDGTQNNVNYQLVLVNTNSNIGGGQAGNGSQLSFATDATPGGAVYPAPGPTSYSYKFIISSAGCEPTETTNHATVSVSAVTADAGGDKNLCIGDGVTIGGSPTAGGGTGYLSVSWSGPSSYSSNSPNPTVTLPGTYTVTVKDNTGATDVDDVLVTGLAKPTIAFVDTLRTQFNYDEAKYQLSNKTIVTPNDGAGVFSGQGVSLNSDGKYYFNPQAFTTQAPSVPITYTHTSANGCSNSKTFNATVNIPGTAITNLKTLYCSNENPTSGLTFNTSLYPMPAGKAFSSFKVYQGYDYINGVYLTYPTSDPNYPLTQNTATSYTFNPTKAYNMVGQTTVFILIYLKDATTHIEDVTWYTYGSTYVVAPGAVPDILPLKDMVIVCEKDPPVTLSNTLESPIFGYTTLNYQETTYNSVNGSGTGPYAFNPDVVNFGPDDFKNVLLKYNYKDANGCVGQAQRTVIVIRKVSGPAAPDQQYCQFFDGTRVLNASSPYDKVTYAWYTSSSLSDLEPGTGSVFDTQISTQNPVTKTYYVTQNFRGCESNYSTVTISITPAPVINLNFDSPCENRPSTYVGPVPPGSSPSYSWSFSGDSQSYNTKDVEHTFSNAGPASISLVVKSTSNGQECSTSATQTIVVGQNPKAAVTFDQLCNGDNTNFQASSNLTIDEVYWDFGDGDVLPQSSKATVINDPSGHTTGTYQAPHHKFTNGEGEYTVELRVYTNLHCSDTLKKTLRILPLLSQYNSLNPYHMEEINGGDGFWAVDSSSVNSSWQFTAPNDTVIHSIQKAWVTNGDKNVSFGDYKPNDHSAVNSPCFDITGFERPVFAMNMISNSGERSDGAVLQVSTDGGLTWKVIGVQNSGLNWYNVLGISGSAPGEQGLLAWSGDLWTTNPGETDPVWLQAKHSLNLPENILPSAKKNKVRFRIAFASNGDTQSEGFAFNNVHIEDRNRIMLVENFTNVSAEGATVNNTRFNIPQNDVVKIQYNVSFPGEDEINLQNPTDPSARGAFYGIANTSQVVPRVYIDGTSGGKLTGSDDWFDQSKSLRSLVTSPLDISISTVPASASQLTVVTQITPNQTLTEGKLVAHVAIVENPVDGNEFVLRKMLPNASGTVLALPLTTGVPITLPALTWQVDNTHVDPANLAVVVFVQNEDTKEVLQASMLEHPADLPTAIVTGTEPSFSQQTSLYPNPADHQLVIHMPQAARKDIPLSVFDTFGHEVLQRTIVTGEQQVLVNTSTFAAGVYLIQFEPSPGVQVRKKVVVTHR
ncbi:MAG TPA: Ig-like domain-containing protein [Chryseolinea sp.]